MEIYRKWRKDKDMYDLYGSFFVQIGHMARRKGKEMYDLFK